ncbi:hypothetical protein AB4455_22710 [Vibrio sp. 10N.261.46.E12]|uniref:hypothetical protein n=1 Tax=unclassified Vibrio TaxID=2614977 RepID=UPI0009783E91|nr:MULTISPECIES: hypothetical protein [unclassified Vibrio]OMO35813.1 hypothetical protein BH584_06910 [Vibrio sp. 10N.261.45.E1]PMJ34956.1 hypothetical protein BCU27_24525 [Vibrio sp. 10N.286.45.B6]PML86968.1 hypothetical protein BCT66_12985 [Vibrio sp. 10N.261.49.E11]PMM75129.1 hypothetical protein BCT48_25475 [Vibrio sp. 10N.261.46.F12]PMM85745.1 hypothetical protein BCT46_08765 [Vibrio sp. 10N.261.46.E8]
MNLQKVCNLVKEAGLTRAIITIDTSGDDAVVLLTVPTANGATPNIDNAKEMALRSALSSPLKVMGHVAEVDSVLDSEIDKFGEGLVPAAKALESVTSNASSTAAKQKTAASTNGNKANKQPQRKPKSLKTPANETSTGNKTTTPPAEKQEKPVAAPAPTEEKSAPQVDTADLNLDEADNNMDFFGAMSL